MLLAWDEPRQRLVKRLRQAGVPLLVLVVVAPGVKLAPGPLADEPGRLRTLELGKIESQLAALK